ncbi:YecH family metal-binding protein [Zophobihabitans entericus]|uniref:YecH family protein n=1 Tax=Zophobihabitans entericus TaxID=1635327 RepID=A0A6G9IBK2_9GAMM|nr:YecH family metal-binding protein [Zophobihabitans entericus]QIQ20960.1 YecH family protein [Zophobihabitans entericus]
MSSIHGHEVLHMMHEQNYTEDSLLTAINQKFGENARFHTCSKEDMTAQELIALLKHKGKFKPAGEQQFTVDSRKICRH